jgi:hypothetical protein
VEFEIPRGYFLKSEDDNHFCIGFQYGALDGEEGHICLPKNKMDKFCENNDWRINTIALYGKIIHIGSPESNDPLPKHEPLKDGIVPDDWD